MSFPLKQVNNIFNGKEIDWKNENMRKSGLVYSALKQQHALVFTGSFTASLNLSELTTQWTSPPKIKYEIKYIYTQYYILYKHAECSEGACYFSLFPILSFFCFVLHREKSQNNSFENCYMIISTLLFWSFCWHHTLSFKLPWDLIIALFIKVAFNQFGFFLSFWDEIDFHRQVKVQARVFTRTFMKRG